MNENRSQGGQVQLIGFRIGAEHYVVDILRVRELELLA